MSQKSKVKSYARRTKSGIARVTGHSRKSDKRRRNRNIAIGVGVGTSILALGLGAKHLAKKKGLKGNTTPQAQAQAVSFTPTTSPPSAPKPKPKVETPSATVSEVRQTTQAVNTKPTSGSVKLKSKKPRRLHTIKDSSDYSYLLKVQKMVPKGVKVESINTSRMPKNRRYTEPSGEVYTHATHHRSLPLIEKAGKLIPSTTGFDGPGLYLHKGSARTNDYNAVVYEFPADKILAKNLRIGKGIGMHPLLDNPLPTKEASKVVIRADHNNRYDKPKKTDLRIRYRKQLDRLINFTKQVAAEARRLSIIKKKGVIISDPNNIRLKPNLNLRQLHQKQFAHSQDP